MKLWRWLVQQWTTGECTQAHHCGNRVEKVGPWYARHRRYAYCPECMELIFGVKP